MFNWKMYNVCRDIPVHKQTRKKKLLNKNQIEQLPSKQIKFLFSRFHSINKIKLVLSDGLANDLTGRNDSPFRHKLNNTIPRQYKIGDHKHIDCECVSVKILFILIKSLCGQGLLTTILLKFCIVACLKGFHFNSM